MTKNMIEAPNTSPLKGRSSTRGIPGTKINQMRHKNRKVVEEKTKMRR